MILEGWECKGCGRPVFYNWPTHAGDSRDDYYFHVVCFLLKDGSMKRLSNPVLPSNISSGKQQQAEPKLSFEPCMVCGKQIMQGYYGRWNDGGTCSKQCESTHERKV